MKRIVFIALFVVWLVCYLPAVEKKCPSANVINKMSSTMKSYQAVAPLDFTQIHSAGAMLSKNGQKLSVCLSNGDYKINQMVSSFVVPIKTRDKFIAVIQFRNGREKIVPGVYKAASGYAKPFWAFAEVKLHKGEKGVIVSLGVREGTAEIVEMTQDRICGTFHLRTKKGSSNVGVLSGTFNVKLSHSRWRP